MMDIFPDPENLKASKGTHVSNIAFINHPESVDSDHLLKLLSSLMGNRDIALVRFPPDN